MTCESKIVTQARLNPLRICWAMLGPALLLLAHPLEDQHVGVDRHADRQRQARQARQGERACMTAIEPSSRIMFRTRATTATTPAKR